MILDKIENLHRYAIPLKDDIAAYLRSDAAARVDVPEIEIKGRDLFVRPQKYQTKPAAECRFERHHVYADLQYVMSGAEIMQVVLSSGGGPITEYDSARDCQFFTFEEKGSELLVPAGYFAVFFPGEAHRTCCQVAGRPEQAQKLVFKVRMAS